MNNMYRYISRQLKENCPTTVINSYENLPTRNSPKTLITSYNMDDQEEYDDDEYPFFSLDRINQALSPKEDIS